MTVDPGIRRLLLDVAEDYEAVADILDRIEQTQRVIAKRLSASGISIGATVPAKTQRPPTPFNDLPAAMSCAATAAVAASDTVAR
jgi:hypothetical protein